MDSSHFKGVFLNIHAVVICRDSNGFICRQELKVYLHFLKAPPRKMPAPLTDKPLTALLLPLSTELEIKAELGHK